MRIIINLNQQLYENGKSPRACVSHTTKAMRLLLGFAMSGVLANLIFHSPTECIRDQDVPISLVNSISAEKRNVHFTGRWAFYFLFRL